MSVVLQSASRLFWRQGRNSLEQSPRTIFRPILTLKTFTSVDAHNAHRIFSSSNSSIVTETNENESPFIRRPDRPLMRPSLYHVKKPGSPRILRSTRLCPTRDLNHTPEMWAGHKAPGRHLRNMLTVFGCASFQRLVFPDLFLTASVAAGLTYYNLFLGGADPFSFDTAAFTSCSLGISVLAGFRLNASYGRFNEARRIWGQVNNTSRDLMGQACMYLNERNKQRMKNLLKAYSVALHFHLNMKGGHFKLNSTDPETPGKVKAAFIDEMREIFLPADENGEYNVTEPNPDANADVKLICEAYQSGSHVPLLISAFMRKTIMESETPVDPRFIVAMDREVSNLVICLGGCERILRTPIPTTYTTNTSRLLSLWSLTLPLGLYPLTGPEWTLPMSVLLSFVVLSIEDVGVEIEEPFHVLPLRQYTEGTADSLDVIEKAYTLVCTDSRPTKSDRVQNPQQIANFDE
mmetsp:Transcript_14740/g.41071  ORF Transcript_14740/g.41071 Transcript_14740/m.41071 type:complete len:463 (+) Transcript_14740:118-1506(+)